MAGLARNVLALLGCLPLAAYAQGPSWEIDQWEPIGTSSDRSVVFVRKTSIRTLPPKTGRDFAVVEVWVGKDYTAVKGSRAVRGLELHRYDCDGRTFNLISFVSYDAKGSVVQRATNIDDYDFKYDPVAPGSVSEGIMQAVC